MATSTPPAASTRPAGPERRSDDISTLDDGALLTKADELAAVAETLRAKKDADGADRAAGAAQHIRDHVARRRLAATEADNYARANAPQQIETEE